MPKNNIRKPNSTLRKDSKESNANEAKGIGIMEEKRTPVKAKRKEKERSKKPKEKEANKAMKKKESTTPKGSKKGKRTAKNKNIGNSKATKF